MEERKISRSWRPQGLLKKFSFSNGNTAREKEQARLVLLLIFGGSVLAIVFATGYRELPKFLKSFWAPKTVVTEKFLIVPSPTPTPAFENEKRAVEEILAPLRGEYGVFYQELESGLSFSISGKQKFSTASLNKLPLLLTLYREAEAGRVNLDAEYSLQAADKRDGAGSLRYKPAGFNTNLREMARLMGKQSDNTAFNILSRIVGGEKVQAVIDALGMKNTSFVNWETSPEDIGLFFRKLYREKIVNEKNRDEILSFLTDTIWEDRIPAGLPKNIKVAHKVGTEIGVISDAGIVFAEKPFVLIILTKDANEIEAKKALPEISKKIYEFHQKITSSPD